MAHAARGPRFTFFGGKGGVGKTTCAAAAAVRAASEGARVLVVSTDPAHSLSDALGVELWKEPRVVRDVGIGELCAAELDADKALSRWLKDREKAIRTIADRGTYLDDDDIDRFLSLSFPGVDELVGLVELLRLSRQRDFDHVVVDTAPTGHTLRLLEMPRTLGRISEVLDDMHAKHRFLASSIGGSYNPDFADEVIADIAQEADTLKALLKDPRRSSFTWVTLAEELPAHESLDGISAIEEMGVDVELLVINRVWPVPDKPCALCTPRVEAEHGWRKHLYNTFLNQEVLEVPARIVEPQGVAQLRELAMSVRYPMLAKPRKRKPPMRSARAIEEAATMRLQGVTTAIVPSTKLVMFGGKGGVGKTTAAAASAIELADSRRNDRVLILSTDPAHSLGDVLGTKLSDKEQPVPNGPKNLVVRELDATRAWEEQRERYKQSIDDLFSSIFTGNMDAKFDRAVLEDLLDLAPPGIDELLALVTILDALIGPEPDPVAEVEQRLDEEEAIAEDELEGKGMTGDEPTVAIRSLRLPPLEPKEDKKPEKPRFDLVIVDTAPTGHTLRLLALPEKALEWVHTLMSVILKYRSVVGLGELASDLTVLSKRLRTLIALLSDPAKCAFMVVTRPAALPRVETERLAAGLRRLKVPVTAIIANAVTEPSCARCTEAAEIERGELERLEKLAVRAARSPRLLCAPAVYPGPRGVLQLSLWRSTWTERTPLSARSLVPEPPDQEPNRDPDTETEMRWDDIPSDLEPETERNH